MSTVKYRPEIDGLRALAVMSVAIFHINKAFLPGGFIGVDIFFVISGFLITSIILREDDSNIFKLTSFWLRRVKRIAPALIVTTLFVLLFGRLTLYGPAINDLGGQGIASLLSYANISYWIIAGNYWGESAENLPLLHTWSLSVEEQFYLFFPWITILSLKFYKKNIFWIYIAFTFTSFFLFLYGAQFKPAATFYLLPTRAWELGAGSICAFIFTKNGSAYKANRILSLTGLLSILLSFIFLGTNEEISSLIVIPVIGTSLILLFANNSNNTVNHILSFSPIVYIGKISYSLYLWHWPILFFFHQLDRDYNQYFHVFAALALIFFFSILSYHLIELPFRRNDRTLYYVLPSLLICIGLSTYLKLSNFSQDLSNYNKTFWLGQLYNVNPHKEWPESIKKRMEGIITPTSNTINNDAYQSGGIIKLYGNKEKPEIVILGDSHALMWAPVLDESAKYLKKSISFYSADGTPPFFDIPVAKSNKHMIYYSTDEKYAFDCAILKYLNTWRPKIVIIGSRWSRGDDMQKIAPLIEYIGKLGSKVLLIEQPPELFFIDKSAPQYLSYLGIATTGERKGYLQNTNTNNYIQGINTIHNITQKYSYCKSVSVYDLFVKDNKVLVVDAGNVLYTDDDHLSYAGAQKAKDRILQAIKILLD